MPRSHDRGAFETLRFDRCARGFTLRSDGRMGEIGWETFAFDNIADLALWLVREYGPVSDSADAAPETDCPLGGCAGSMGCACSC